MEAVEFDCSAGDLGSILWVGEDSLERLTQPFSCAPAESHIRLIHEVSWTQLSNTLAHYLLENHLF